MSALRDLCRAAGLRQTGLAEALGVGRSAISEWSLGKRSIPPHRMADLCSLLGCEPADLLGPEPTFPPFAYRPVVWFAQQTCLMCGTPVDATLRCPRCRRAVA